MYAILVGRGMTVHRIDFCSDIKNKQSIIGFSLEPSLPCAPSFLLSSLFLFLSSYCYQGMFDPRSSVEDVEVILRYLTYILRNRDRFQDFSFRVSTLSLASTGEAFLLLFSPLFHLCMCASSVESPNIIFASLLLQLFLVSFESRPVAWSFCLIWYVLMRTSRAKDVFMLRLLMYFLRLIISQVIGASLPSWTMRHTFKKQLVFLWFEVPAKESRRAHSAINIVFWDRTTKMTTRRLADL